MFWVALYLAIFLQFWTILLNLVPTKGTSQRNYNMVPSRVHDCQSPLVDSEDPIWVRHPTSLYGLLQMFSDLSLAKDVGKKNSALSNIRTLPYLLVLKCKSKFFKVVKVVGSYQSCVHVTVFSIVQLVPVSGQLNCI